MPPERCIKTLGRTTNRGRRLSSGSHHLVFTVLHDIQWLPPSAESKRLQPKAANPIPQTTKSVRTKQLHFVGEVFPFSPLIYTEGRKRKNLTNKLQLFGTSTICPLRSQVVHRPQ